MVIRDFRLDSEADLAAVVRIHCAAFPDFFLTEMGPRLLTAYYRTVLQYPGSVFLLAENRTTATGFVVGFCCANGFYSLMKRQWWRFLVPLLLGMMRRPQLVRAMFYNAFRVFVGRGALQRDPRCSDASESELASIAVDPAYGRKGVGRDLVLAFCDRIRDLGAQTVTLTTERDGNEAVNRFYRNLGFSAEREFKHGANRMMLEYVLRLRLDEWL